MTTDRTMADAINQYHKGAVVPLKNKLNRVFLSEGNFTIPAGGWILENEKYAANISASVTANDNAAVFFDDSIEVYREGEISQGAIKIFAASLPADSIQGSYHIFEGDSFMGKAIVMTGNNGDSVFVGATSITSGVAGNVPAPLAGDQDKFLRGNGQWATIPSGGSGGGDLVINDDEVQEVTVVGGALQASIDGGGKFGNCLNVTGTSNKSAFTAQALGRKDFTLQFWNKTDLKSGTELEWQNSSYCVNVNSKGGYYKIDNNGDAFTTTKPVLSDWQHLAVCYDHAAGKLYCFVGGELVHTFDCTIPRENLQNVKFNASYFDEVLLLDGVCMWKENFTPPTEPF